MILQYDLIRASGVTALILFTVTVVLGLMNRSRFATDRWPRFVIDGVHRNVSLLAMVFLVVHILTSVTDHYVSLPLPSAFIPFAKSYSPLWVGLGALSWDLMLAVVITSLLRTRVGLRSWRAVHWSSYLAWPLALIHGVGEGNDSWTTWMVAINVCCTAAVLAALAVRLWTVPRLEAV